MLERKRQLASDYLALVVAFGLLAVQPGLRSREISGERLWFAFGITASFALVAWLARGVTRSGALAGAIVSFSLTISEPKLFVVLLAVFLLTLLATRWGKRRKQQLSTAEGARGRSAAQVISNLGFAMFVIATGTHQQVLLVVAVMAEVAADTCSSELGMAFPGRTVLLTSWAPVSPGVDGGISLRGTLAALVSALVIGGTGATLQLITTGQALVAAGSGFAGMLVDSLFGAVLEQRGYLNNDAVNILSTASAAALAWALS